MKKTLSMLLATALMLCVCAGCSGQQTSPGSETSSGNGTTSQTGTPSSSSKVYTLKIGTITAPTHPTSIAATKLVEMLDERSGGRIKAELYLAEQLGNEVTQLENIQSGLQECMISSSEKFGNYNADFNILGMAFAFESKEHVEAFLNSEWGQAMNQDLIDNFGLRNLNAYFWKLPRALLAKTPILTPDDLAGKKIRIPNIPIWEKNFTALGASPVIINYADFPMALLTGVVDVGETTYETIYGMKLHEGGPCISMVDYAYPLELCTVSESWWQSLEPEIQQIFEECVQECASYYYDLNMENWEAEKKLIEEEGGTFYEVDRQVWMDAVKPLAEQLEAEQYWQTPGLYEKVQSLR